MCVSGLTSFQRALSMASKSSETAARGPPVELWQDLSSLNNLADVYKLYSGGRELKKEARDTFVNGTLQDVAEDFQAADDLLCKRRSRHPLGTRKAPAAVLRALPAPGIFCRHVGDVNGVPSGEPELGALPQGSRLYL
ncbi:hypothetical protein HPB51_016527 [Rhipicephalus microplus]|uniref:DNA mitochondrial polymerase exonuclease domain-containing protein n=1 Tax=Rhipicephalus microplus TaxID=6941 RepID=A0A9J6E295_RHIMP|nr:hypothetical protein HPB51_016527 [Rhipicephalus microplus]